MMSRGLICAIGIAIIIAIGCGGKVGVSGQVTLDDKPQPGVSVYFMPIGEGRPANGVTDEKGQFTLTTETPNDGADAGEYKVTVAKAETTPTAKEGMSVEEIIAKSKLRDQQAQINAFHPNYANFEQTPLRVTIPPKRVTLKLNAQGT